MGPTQELILLPQQNPNQRNRTRTRSGAPVAPSGGSTNTRGAGELGVEIGADGIEPAIGIGGGLTIGADGDLGLRVAPGVSIDLT